ncbi:hypothetical protein [Leptothermofonsia sp. ETS-13]|uniref:hypothetical protein n=1 Tax=Leptothermofonsia sp. ETS-13 TaxID=3035696 RepID=UPI003BA33F22
MPRVKKGGQLTQLIAVVMVTGGCAPMVSSPPVAMPPAQPSPELAIQYQAHSLPQATVHSLRIPVQAFQVTPCFSRRGRRFGCFRPPVWGDRRY